MRRRAFIAAFAASAATWPLTARAQQPIRRVAVLNPARDTDPEYQRRLGALTDALQKLGWTDGRNISIDIRWAGARPEEIQQIASSLVSLAPDIIIASGSVATAAVKRATPRISVLFLVVNEPVLQGFVPSLARPGGNMTGFTNVDFSVVGKMVELLRDMVPALHRIGLMFNSDAYPIYNNYLHTLQTEHRASVEVVRASVRSPAEIDAVIDGLTALPESGLVILPDGGFTIANRATIQAAVDRHRLPSIGPFRQFAAEGALMSYGPDDIDIYRRAADYVDRILKGAKPADLPVQQPVKFDFVINRKTAMALGVEIPAPLNVLADGVIE